MLSLVRMLVVLVAVAVGVAFGYLNFQATWVDVFWTRLEAPLVAVLAVAFVAGALIALLLTGGRLLRQRAQLASTRRKLKDAEAEIASLRQQQTVRDA